MKQISGQNAALIIYNHIGKSNPLDRQEIPEKIEFFVKGLETFLNSGAFVWIGFLIIVGVLGALFIFWKMRPKPRLISASSSSVLDLKEGETAVVLYISARDKIRAFSSWIREGLVNGEAAAYIYPDEENDVVRSEFAAQGIDVEKYEKAGTLFLQNVSEHFMWHVDKERAVQFYLRFRDEAYRKGCKHLRWLEDVGDFSLLKGPWRAHYEDWDNPRMGKAPGAGIVHKPFVMEVIAINVGSMKETQADEVIKTYSGGKKIACKINRLY